MGSCSALRHWSKFVIRIVVLCQGWHCSSTTVLLKSMEGADKKKLIASSAPYLLRMYKMLSHSGIHLDLQLSNTGHEFLDFVEVRLLSQYHITYWIHAFLSILYDTVAVAKYLSSVVIHCGIFYECWWLQHLQIMYAATVMVLTFSLYFGQLFQRYIL